MVKADPSPVLVDTNVLLDVLNDDPAWGDWSDARLVELRPRGLLINPVVFAELAVAAPSLEVLDTALERLGIALLEPSRAALYRAAKAFLAYRRAGGQKRSPLPDFYLRAQAEIHHLPLLTRDASRIRTYFPGVELICP